MVELTEEQKILKREMYYWYTHKTKPYYYYSGRAGTGKTTVVSALLEDLEFEQGEYVSCAYVGKAVMVLLRKGYSAMTLHALLYNVIIEYLHDVSTTSDGEVIKSKKRVMHFELKKKLSESLKLIIVDECKMVNDDMIRELLSFGIPVIFMGDENQLPPVIGSSTILKEPDFILTQIMRQAEDDPIVRIANMILDGIPLEYGVWGNSKIVPSIPFDKTILTNYDAILCGKNKTREFLNYNIRTQILHMNPKKLYNGEKLICRQNNWDEELDGIYLTNGTVGFIEDIHYDTITKNFVEIDFRPDFLDNCFENIRLDRKYFHLPYDQRANYGISNYNKFEFGYAFTVHLAQGSEYDDVLFIGEKMFDQDTTKRLWYTAVTRAKKSITIIPKSDRFLDMEGMN